MSGVNRVFLLGRLGKDPELKTVQGNSVCNFSIATSESYKDKTTGEKKETTEWHNVVFWRALADVAGKYLKKGDMIYMEGKIKTRSWEKDGVTRYTTEILGDKLTMIQTSKKEGGAKPSAAPEPEPETFGSDDLPF